MEADHRFDERYAESEETRMSLSYDLDTASWMGRHRIAGALGRRKVVDLIQSSKLAFLGAPFGGSVDDNDNTIWNRYYPDENDLSTYPYQQTLVTYDL